MYLFIKGPKFKSAACNHQVHAENDQFISLENAIATKWDETCKLMGRLLISQTLFRELKPDETRAMLMERLRANLAASEMHSLLHLAVSCE